VRLRLAPGSSLAHSDRSAGVMVMTLSRLQVVCEEAKAASDSGPADRSGERRA
jgi:hypothetical protein